jgi:hypothetical protein
MPLRAMMALVKVLLLDKGLCFLDDRDGIIFVRAIRSGRFSNERLRTYESRNRRYRTATTFEPSKACGSGMSRSSFEKASEEPGDSHIPSVSPMEPVAGRKSGDHGAAESDRRTAAGFGEPRVNAAEVSTLCHVRCIDLCAGTAAETLLHSACAPWIAHSDSAKPARSPR